MIKQLSDPEIINRSREANELLTALENPTNEQLEELLGFHTNCEYLSILDILNQDVKSDKIAVLTHPFFNLKENYEKRLNKFIQTFSFPLIILSYDIKEDSIKIENLSSRKEQFYLAAGYQIAVPQAGFDIVARIINGFSPKEVLLGGAKLGYDERGNPAQCVGFTYNNLKNKVPSLKIDKNICNM